VAKIKEIQIYQDLYQVNISFLVGGRVEDLIRLIRARHAGIPLYSWGKEFEWGKDANTTDGYQFHVNAELGDGERFYVWVHHKSPSLMYHEVFHLVGDILYTRGVEYAEASEEAFAYLGGWIFEKLHKK
jgi:hypothetical protein